MNLIQGVYTSFLDLSWDPPLGKWSITVSVHDDVMKESTFEVEYYMLPKFSIDLDVPEKTAVSDGKLTIGIRSRYFPCF